MSAEFISSTPIWLYFSRSPRKQQRTGGEKSAIGRIINYLMQGGITNMERLNSMTENEIIAIPGIRKASCRYLQETLEDFRAEFGNRTWEMPDFNDVEMRYITHEMKCRRPARYYDLVQIFFTLALDESQHPQIEVMERIYYKLHSIHRTIVTKIKKKYMRGGVFRVPYSTKAGPKVCEFYHDGFRKRDTGFDNVQDTLPQYLRYDGRNTLANRLRAGVCEMCGGKTEDIRMHHVRSLKKLTGKTESERLMMKMRRKSLALCPDCYANTHV